ncbi:MAG: DUF4492 domain-containing protein [Candidatus Symbiothrix sp.]|jgi:hypothetical protein|nr:DUF4492 domain-containing protein [Candidatus Symbiothrix sp.]
MCKSNIFLQKFCSLYVEGFRNLTWGKPLWILIIIKLFIIFAVLKVFFFPDFLGSRFKTEKAKSEYIMHELTKRNINEKHKLNESHGFKFD